MEYQEEFSEEGYYEEPDRRSEVIASCLNAISAIEHYDIFADERAIKRVKNMSLKLIDYYISEMYYEHFEEYEE